MSDSFFSLTKSQTSLLRSTEDFKFYDLPPKPNDYIPSWSTLDTVQNNSTKLDSMDDLEPDSPVKKLHYSMVLEKYVHYSPMISKRHQLLKREDEKPEFYQYLAESSNIDQIIREDSPPLLRDVLCEKIIFDSDEEEPNEDTSSRSASSSIFPEYNISPSLEKPVTGCSLTKEDFLRECQAQEALSLKAFEEKVANNETFTSMIQNEKKWEEGLSKASTVLQECKNLLKALDQSSIIVSDNSGAIPRKVIEYIPARHAESATSPFVVNSGVFRREDLNSVRVQDLNESVSTNLGSEGSGLRLSKVGQDIVEEVEKEIKRKALYDQMSFDSRMQNKETMTDLIQNEFKRAQELEECCFNIQELTDALKKLLSKVQ